MQCSVAQIALRKNLVIQNKVPTGWTLFTPSDDSRIMYVSNDGDDSTAKVYGSTDFANPFEPGVVYAYATYQAAYLQSRDGYPDWILLQSGDTFIINMSMRSGRSTKEYALIGSYGFTGSMPLVHPLVKTSPALTIPGATSFSAVSGIDFYAVSRNPAISGYSIDGYTGFSGVTGRTISDILIEGCRFRFFAGNQIQSYNEGVTKNIIIRRTVISDNYSNGDGHSQGLYAGFVNGILLEENIFDHNGWYAKSPETPGTATMFNHNTYFEDCHNVVFLNNIFSRGSSMGNKFTANTGVASSTNITIKNNFYLDGEIGVGIGGNVELAYRFNTITVEGNVFTEIGRSRPTNRTLGWALDAVGWDNGSITGNYFLNFSNPDVTNIYGIRLEGGVGNVQINNNIINNLNPHGKSNRGYAMLLAATQTVQSSVITISGNQFLEPMNELVLIKIDNENDFSAITFLNNKYFSSNENSAFQVVDSMKNTASWSSLAGDNSTFSQTDFPDSSRNVETYMQSIGATSTIDGFIEGCRNQTRYNWDSNYTAQSINYWIKSGFSK